MDKELFKRNPFTAFAIALDTLLFGQALLVGDDSVISNAMIQARWCGNGDYICLVRHYICISLAIIVLCFIIDFFLKRNRKKSEGDSVNYLKASPKKQAALKPEKSELALQMRLDIQEFREILKPIKNESSKEQKEKLTLARNKLNKIINEQLPKTTFSQHEKIEQKFQDLDVKFQDYCVTLKSLELEGYVLDALELKKRLWGRLDDDNSLESAMFLLVRELIDLLNREHRNLDGEQKEIVSPIVEKFSTHLEELKKERMSKYEWKITGIGLGFLENIKTAPPFLGLRHEKPIISPSDEHTLTEFFIASIYMEKYRDSIRGGTYVIRSGDDAKTIAKSMYGDERYEAYVPAQHTYSNGSILKLPYVNRETTDYSESVKNKIDVSNKIEHIKSLLSSYHLVRDESIPLLRMIYDASQKTLLDERKT